LTINLPRLARPEDGLVASIDTESELRTPSVAGPFPGPAVARELHSLAASLSLCLVCAASLSIYLLLPLRDGSQPSWQRPYPGLLALTFVVAVLAAATQYVWRSARPLVRHYAPLLAGGFGVLCLYDLATAKYDWLKHPFFPFPDEILEALVENRAILARSAWYSLRLLLFGYTAGVVSGLVTGVLIGWFPRARYWGMPILKLVGPLPATALVPIAMTVFLDSASGAAALVALAVWFPVTMLTSSGIANVRLSHLDVARTLGAGPAYLIFRVAIPSALPNVFVGLFMGLGSAFLTLTAAEMLGVEAGLGWYLKWQQGYAEYAKVYATLVVMAALFSTLMTVLFKVRDRVLSWQKGVIKW
jgi:NitT/TauT family transport system permease protein